MPDLVLVLRRDPTPEACALIYERGFQPRVLCPGKRGIVGLTLPDPKLLEPELSENVPKPQTPTRLLNSFALMATWQLSHPSLEMSPAKSPGGVYKGILKDRTLVLHVICELCRLHIAAIFAVNIIDAIVFVIVIVIVIVTFVLVLLCVIFPLSSVSLSLSVFLYIHVPKQFFRAFAIAFPKP